MPENSCLGSVAPGVTGVRVATACADGTSVVSAIKNREVSGLKQYCFSS